MKMEIVTWGNELLVGLSMEKGFINQVMGIFIKDNFIREKDMDGD